MTNNNEWVRPSCDTFTLLFHHFLTNKNLVVNNNFYQIKVPTVRYEQICTNSSKMSRYIHHRFYYLISFSQLNRSLALFSFFFFWRRLSEWCWRYRNRPIICYEKIQQKNDLRKMKWHNEWSDNRTVWSLITSTKPKPKQNSDENFLYKNRVCCVNKPCARMYVSCVRVSGRT